MIWRVYIIDRKNTAYFRTAVYAGTGDNPVFTTERHAARRFTSSRDANHCRDKLVRMGYDARIEDSKA